MISLHGDPTAAPGYEGAGGQNVYVRELARNLALAGTAVDVFTEALGAAGVSAETFETGCRVIRIPLAMPRQVGRHAFKEKLPVFLDRLVRLWPGRAQYDLIHSHYWLAGWVGLRLARTARLPLIHTSHSLGRVKAAAGFTLPDATERLSTEGLLARQSVLVATNSSEERQLRQLYHAQNLALVPCGFAPRHFRPLDRTTCRRSLGLRKNERMLLFVGRFDPNKGIADLIHAVDILSRGWVIKLFLVGGVRPDSPDEAECARIKAMVQDRGLEGCVRFVGAVEPSHLAQYYSAADVTVIPSRYETFGLVALEALACASPVVASRTGGLACTVQDGSNGLLFKPGDVVGLANSISRLLLDPDYGRRLGKAGHDGALRFTWPAVASRMLQVYDGAIERATLPTGSGSL